MSIVDDFSSIGSRLREIGTGKTEEPECDLCFGGGWEMYGTGHHDPHFRECSKCENPKGLPSP